MLIDCINPFVACPIQHANGLIRKQQQLLFSPLLNAMTARFKKVPQVTLLNESQGDEDDYDESDKTVLINQSAEGCEEEEEEGGDITGNGSNRETVTINLSSDPRVGKWGTLKFWRRQKRYEVHHQHAPGAAGEETVRKVTLCGRSFRLCHVNSWRVIFLVLFVFSVAVTVSVIISKLAAEPPEIPTPLQGKSVRYPHSFKASQLDTHTPSRHAQE